MHSFALAIALVAAALAAALPTGNQLQIPTFDFISAKSTVPNRRALQATGAEAVKQCRDTHAQAVKTFDGMTGMDSMCASAATPLADTPAPSDCPSMKYDQGWQCDLQLPRQYG